ncbi:hypothetical protein DAI22_07g056600 [Oryza sativa Japonica Group]|nr:hypothetical protein DAI22_07g056600 [Oryza sativa Japonica Group]
MERAKSAARLGSFKSSSQLVREAGGSAGEGGGAAVARGASSRRPSSAAGEGGQSQRSCTGEGGGEPVAQRGDWGRGREAAPRRHGERRAVNRRAPLGREAEAVQPHRGGRQRAGGTDGRLGIEERGGGPAGGGVGDGAGGGGRQLLSPVAARRQSCARAAACLRLRGIGNGEGRTEQLG